MLFTRWRVHTTAKCEGIFEYAFMRIQILAYRWYIYIWKKKETWRNPAGSFSFIIFSVPWFRHTFVLSLSHAFYARQTLMGSEIRSCGAVKQWTQWKWIGVPMDGAPCYRHAAWFWFGRRRPFVSMRSYYNIRSLSHSHTHDMELAHIPTAATHAKASKFPN